MPREHAQRRYRTKDQAQKPSLTRFFRFFLLTFSLSSCMLKCAIDFFFFFFFHIGYSLVLVNQLLREPVLFKIQSRHHYDSQIYCLREVANKQIPFVFRLIWKMRICSRKHSKSYCRLLGKLCYISPAPSAALEFESSSRNDQVASS